MSPQAAKTIVVGTFNAGKAAEIAAALAGLPVIVRPLSEYGNLPAATENGTTFAENALAKARHYKSLTGAACLADDSGLEVDALNGAPGVYSARYAGPEASDVANNEKLLAELKDVPPEQRTARFRCVIAFVDVDGTEILAEGRCEGRIISSPRGSGGFGYDPLFLLSEENRTMAELSIEEKNAVSHRGRALAALKKEMVRRFGGL